MNATKFVIMAIIALASLSFISLNMEENPIPDQPPTLQKTNKVLRHVVMFKFKEGSPEEKIREVESAFSSLPGKISEIKDYEWGTNNSPEGLDKGFTHCFFVTFSSEEGRAAYLPHPDHQAFVQILQPHLEDVLVLDYWTK
jgi:hypothetical protein